MTPPWTETHITAPGGGLERVYRMTDGHNILTLDACMFDQNLGYDMEAGFASEWANFMRVVGTRRGDKHDHAHR